MNLEIVILAAGQGTRMRSSLPKVLHPVGGRMMLEHILDTASEMRPQRLHIVYGYGGAAVPDALAHWRDAGESSKVDIRWVEQTRQLGTGHAVRQALPGIDDDSIVLVLIGDIPLIEADTLAPLVAAAADGRLALLTASLGNPSGYGRIVRDASGDVRAIVEQRDCDEVQLSIKEVNTGCIAAPVARLAPWLDNLKTDNAQQEMYLTDIVAMAVADGTPIAALAPQSQEEILGVNDKADLARIERMYQARRAERLMAQGVTLIDPTRVDVRGEVHIGADTRIDVNVVLEGPCEIGERVHIGPNTLIKASRIATDAVIHANSVIDGAEVGAGATVGPFARLRPGAVLGKQVHIGNFVEVKNSRVEDGAKANHLAYLGDAQIGGDTNIGAGVITCNYDGAAKHSTEIGADVFVGSNAQLVAPVRVEDGATVGAGSTITDDVPAGNLAVSRARQRNIPRWKRPKKPRQE